MEAEVDFRAALAGVLEEAGEALDTQRKWEREQGQTEEELEEEEEAEDRGTDAALVLQVKRLVRRVGVLQQEKEAQEAEFQTQREKDAVRIHELTAHLEVHLKKLKDGRDAARKELVKEKERTAELEEALDRVNAEKVLLEANLDVHKQQQQDSPEQQEHQRVEDERRELEIEVNLLRERTVAKDKEKAELEHQLQQFLTEMGSLQDEVRTAQSAADDAEETVSGLRTRNAQLEEEIAQLKKEQRDQAAAHTTNLANGALGNRAIRPPGASLSTVSATSASVVGSSGGGAGAGAGGGGAGGTGGSVSEAQRTANRQKFLAERARMMNKVRGGNGGSSGDSSASSEPGEFPATDLSPGAKQQGGQARVPDLRTSMGGGNGSEADTPTSSTSGSPVPGKASRKWVEHTDPAPCPEFGLDSPVIQLLLQNWSQEPQKVQYLRMWLNTVCKGFPLPEDFPTGLQLVDISTAVKDGMTMLLLPIVRSQTDVPLRVYLRTKGDDLFDIRLKISTKKKSGSRSRSRKSASTASSSVAPASATSGNATDNDDGALPPNQRTSSLNSMFEEAVEDSSDAHTDSNALTMDNETSNKQDPSVLRTAVV